MQKPVRAQVRAHGAGARGAGHSEQAHRTIRHPEGKPLRPGCDLEGEAPSGWSRLAVRTHGVHRRGPHRPRWDIGRGGDIGVIFFFVVSFLFSIRVMLASENELRCFWIKYKHIHVSIKSIWFNASFKASVFLLTFCLDDPSF